MRYHLEFVILAVPAAIFLVRFLYRLPADAEAFDDPAADTVL